MDDNIKDISYRLLIERKFKPLLQRRKGVTSVKGKLAFLYDENYMKTSGYAAVISDVMEEEVLLVPHYNGSDNSHIKIENDLTYIKYNDEWHPMRAIFRFVTQKLWTRIPLNTKTKILNPVIACLAGGLNKMVAAKAYDFYNTELEASGLKITTPETIRDVSKTEIPLWVMKMGGQEVVKIPYSNAGQGV